MLNSKKKKFVMKKFDVEGETIQFYIFIKEYYLPFSIDMVKHPMMNKSIGLLMFAMIF